jgi:hypothetical protein
MIFSAISVILYGLKVACGAFSGHYFDCRRQKAWLLPAAFPHEAPTAL